MNLVEALGGYINADHVVCAIRQDYDTKGFVNVVLTNSDSFPIREAHLVDLPIFKINDRTWVNPEHVSTIALNVDRAKKLSESNKDGSSLHDKDYVAVEFVMDHPKYRMSFFAEGSRIEDVYAWMETLKTWKEVM